LAYKATRLFVGAVPASVATIAAVNVDTLVPLTNVTLPVNVTLFRFVNDCPFPFAGPTSTKF
jgi:hypothetical protein